MSSQWIKMRVSLRDDPRVVALALRLGQPRAAVLGGLFLVWCIADAHGDFMPGVTPASLSELVGLPGFVEALPADWIQVRPDGLRFPDYDTHNGSTAKARAMSQKRMTEQRVRNRYGASVTKAQPEKRREEKDNYSSSPPAGGDGNVQEPQGQDYPPGFVQFWTHYPRKVGKGEAFAAWKRMSRADKEAAIDRAEWFAGCWKANDPNGDRAQFIPHPGTWLRQRRWEDASEAVEMAARGK